MADLRSKDAKNTAALERTKTVNKRLRALLDANNIPIPPGLEDIDQATFVTAFQVLEAAGGLHMLQPSTPKARLAPETAVDLTNPQIAIDFILALEEPCLTDHHNHVGPDGETGHAMMLQSSVLQYAPSSVPTASGHPFATGSSWNVPRTQLEEQLDRLLDTSLKLNLKGEMTPVMCWNKVREHHKATPISTAQFRRLQRELVADVLCYGLVLLGKLLNGN